MKFFCLLTALIECAAASSEEKGFPLQEELRALTLTLGSDAANNLPPTPRSGGLTGSRRTSLRSRMTTATQQVSNEFEFKEALKLGDNTVIELTKDIVLDNTIRILGITGVVINGNGFKVEGENAVRCFIIDQGFQYDTINGHVLTDIPPKGSAVFFNDLTITNCNGGAVAVANSYASFTSCPFISNNNDDRAGAVKLTKSDASFTSCRFTSNNAGHGGAVFLSSSTASFTSCPFASNNAGRYGGAIHFGGILNLHNYSFSDNTAPSSGGKDIHKSNRGNGALNLYSLCAGNSFNADTESPLDCAGDFSASPPADLSASACTPCDEGFSCCNVASCPAAELAICTAPLLISTSLPTAVPTLVPTPTPTPVPTLVPTSTPTPLPLFSFVDCAVDTASLDARANAVYTEETCAATCATFDTSNPSELGGQTLTPGCYKSIAALGLTGALTLDGVGNYVFVTPAAMAVAASGRVKLINGANADNIKWCIGAAVVTGAGSTIQGSIESGAAVTTGAGSQVYGHVSGAGAITTGAGSCVAECLTAGAALTKGAGATDSAVCTPF